MNAIIGLTEVLLRKEWQPEEQKFLLNIRSSGKALLKLINDLLDFSKIEAPFHFFSFFLYSFITL